MLKNKATVFCMLVCWHSEHTYCFCSIVVTRKKHGPVLWYSL